MIWKRMNKQPIGNEKLHDELNILFTSECNEKLNKEHLVQWNELSLLYRINEKEGWYISNDGYCYYIRIMNQETHEYLDWSHEDNNNNHHYLNTNLPSH